MDEIIRQLKESMEDNVLSKEEKRSLKEIVFRENLSAEDLNFVRSKIYELAHEKSTSANYQLILDWVKNVNSALAGNPPDQSEAYFSPGEACRQAIIHQIVQAKSQLKICVFTISDDQISEAILAAHKKGIDIRILTDNDKAFDVGSDIGKMSTAGVVIKIDNTANHMHHKFMIVDDRVLLTGSYNWTNSAARYNQENIIITRERELVKLFIKEFERLWNGMIPYHG
jgi:cardiolipin hydrolase